MNRSALIITLLPAMAIAGLLIRFSHLPWTALRIFGLVLAVGGLVLVALARYQLGNSFTLAPQARALVTHGIYSKILNPVYIFSALAIAGLFLYLNRPFFFWIFLILIPLQVIRARAESRVLEARFGDAYRQYRSQTWF
jgi:protein-S-isoprenylcysteine O-methyltransferase Ste14